MRAFLVRVICVVVFFIGLGGIAEKFSLYFEPEENEVIKLAGFPPPAVRVIKLDTSNKIVVRHFRLENPNDCKMKIGPVFPNQFEPKPEFEWEQNVDQ